MVQIDEKKLYDHIIDTLFDNYEDGETGMEEVIKINYTYTLYVYIEVTLSGDGYREDDYFNGTGAYITTYVDANVTSLEISVYNDETEDCEELLDCEGWKSRIEKDLEYYFRD